MKHLLACIAMLTLLASCSDSSSNSNGSNARLDIERRDIEKQELVDAQRVYCNHHQCPKNLAKVLTVTKDYHYSMCTAFLVSNNKVMTNRHCLPSHIKYEGANCSGSMYFTFLDHFPVDCKKVIRLSNNYGRDKVQDYAIIELSKNVWQTPVRINNKGIKNNAALHSWKIDHGSYGEIGYLKKVNCKSQMGSFFQPDYSHKSSRDAALIGCKIIPGNSGSPLFNKKDQVVGIIHSTINREKALNNLKGTKNLVLPRYFNHAALATNFSCIPFSPIHGKFCKEEVEFDYDEHSKKIIEQKFEKLNRELNSIWWGFMPFFEWTLTLEDLAKMKEHDGEDSTFLIRALPKCLKKKARSMVTQSLAYNRPQEVHTPMWEVAVAVDSNYMLGFNFDAKAKKVNFTFSQDSDGYIALKPTGYFRSNDSYSSFTEFIDLDLCEE
jgi:V8-like Glu-specific endopeptidase